jgi:hypothetical protein
MTGLSTRDRTSILAVLSMVLAILSVCAALYQNYIQTKYVEAIQRNVSRGEYNRACRDIIEAYFQVKVKVGFILQEQAGAAGSMPGAMFEIEAANAAGRFGAVGTYLANFQNEDVRYRYTLLARELQRIVLAARQSGERDLDKCSPKPTSCLPA